jgi:hypothetical protein
LPPLFSDERNFFNEKKNKALALSETILFMEEVIGPFGFSDKEPQALLIRGFERRVVIIAP